MFHHRSSVKDKPPQRAKSTTKNEHRVSIKKVNTAALSKQDRLNALRQVRQAKKDELMERRRLGAGWDSRETPPKVVAIVAFHVDVDTASLKRHLLVACGESSDVAAASTPCAPAVVQLPSFAHAGPSSGRPRVLFVDPPRDVLSVLDVAKCADLVLAVFRPHASLEDPAFDEAGYRILTALKSQGLPVVLGAMCGGDEMAGSAKKAGEGKKFVARYFTSEFSADAKLFSTSTDEEMKALVRAIGSATPKDLTWRSDRGYMMAQGAEYSSADGTLCLKGYVRGPGLRCKHLVHLTGHGDFVMSRITTAQDPCPTSTERKGASASGAAAMEQSDRLIDELKDGEQPNLEQLQPYDPTQEEQTWPTKDEMGPPKTPSRRKMIPAPSGLQSGAENEEADADMKEVDEEEGDNDEEDSDADSIPQDSIAGTGDGWDVSSNMTMEVPTAEAVAAEKRRREVLLQRSEEDMEFPDEVDTPLHVSARERFQKYRGLKSFRTSAWDAYEDLPVEYSRVWEFEAFNATVRQLRQQFLDECDELEDGGASMLFCAVYLKGVPPSVMEKQQNGVPFVLSSMFPHEQKVSVVHGTATRSKENTDIMKSKQEVFIHCGFRRFPARPIYSEIPKRASTCKKFKFMRFFQPEDTACVSFFAPSIFPPCRLMMFMDTEAGSELVASGAINGADPKQLIIKRSVLTGYPFRTHKSKGVVRFMFFNPADIRWFKPVELCTKKGLRGHISESLGTHGYMKCRFSGTIKQDDTVCMNLFKRVYPVWYPPSWGGRPDATPQNA